MADQNKNMTQPGSKEESASANGSVGTLEMTPLAPKDKDGNGCQGPAHGISVLTTSVFMVGEMAGAGILSLPKALEEMGYSGIALIFLCGFIVSMMGQLIGKSWIMVQERYEEYRGHVRYPYAALGQITYGRPFRIVLSMINQITMLGSSVVFLIVASQNMQNLLDHIFDLKVTHCILQVLIAACLCPLVWLGTPKDFWPIAVFSASSTFIASVLIVTIAIRDGGDISEVQHKNPTFLGFFSGLGAIVFSYGGISAFPVFQVDMKTPRKFGLSARMAFFTMGCMYLSVSISGYLIYGKSVADNVLNSLPPGPIAYTVQILITVHVTMAFVILMNPSLQEFEELANLPRHFGWRRIAFRTFMVACVLFTASSVPRFGLLLALVGGTVVVLGSYVCPPIIYLRLCSMEGPWPKVEVSLHKKVLLIEVAVVGALSGVIITYGALQELLTPNSMSLPCYLNPNSDGP